MRASVALTTALVPLQPHVASIHRSYINTANIVVHDEGDDDEEEEEQEEEEDAFT